MPQTVPSKPLKPCSQPGCGELVKGGRCDDHRSKADTQRGTSTQRGYKGGGHRQFREGVLARQPICTVCFKAPATEADHWPISRRDLERLGLDPDDPTNGRGLCKPCHSRETAHNQPGGWHAPQ